MSLTMDENIKRWMNRPGFVGDHQLKGTSIFLCSPLFRAGLAA